MSDSAILIEEVEDGIEIHCPECGNSGEVPKWFLGNEMACNECDRHFTVEPREGYDEQ